MKRPQFTVRALLVAMLVVAAFFAGMAMQKRLDPDSVVLRIGISGGPTGSRGEVLFLRDGSTWDRRRK